MKYFISFSLLWLLFVVSLHAQAQEISNQATIVLKNGNIIQGQMIMSMFDDYVSIKLSDTENMDIHYKKIDRIIFGQYSEVEKKKKIRETTEYYFAKPGFMHWAEMGLVTGNNANYESAAYALSTVNGYRFKPYLGVGLGIGIEGYDRINILPIFASARGTLKSARLSPFYFVNLGYAAAWQRNNYDFGVEYDRIKGGIMFQPGAGYQINFKNSSLYFSFGYKLQHYDLSYRYNDGWSGANTEIREKRTMHRASFGIGLTF